MSLRKAAEHGEATPALAASSSTGIFAGIKEFGPLVLLAANPTQGEKAMTDLRPTAAFRAGQIVEENLFYDLVGMMAQLGIK